MRPMRCRAERQVTDADPKAVPRQVAHRRRVVDGGGKVVYTVLYPEAAKALKAIRHHYDCTETAAIEAALKAYARAIPQES